MPYYVPQRPYYAPQKPQNRVQQNRFQRPRLIQGQRQNLSKSARALQFPSRMGIKHFCICVFTVVTLFTFVCLSERKSRTGAYPYCGGTLLEYHISLAPAVLLIQFKVKLISNFLLVVFCCHKHFT
jgi:hypothetical protein